MWKTLRLLLTLACAAFLAAQSRAQPPASRSNDRVSSSKDYANSSIVKRMMAFDKNGDGILTRDEITDPRLLRLFDRADANKDGVVTKEELIALAAKLDAEFPSRGGPGGGPGGPGGPPRPGQILPPFLQEELQLTDEQKKQLEALQHEVDAKLATILTSEQKTQLKEMRERFGPRGRGPRGPGFGGPGGPPPGEGPDRGGPPR